VGGKTKERKKKFERNTIIDKKRGRGRRRKERQEEKEERERNRGTS